MATGDVTLSISVTGGVTKSVTLDSATRVLSRARVEASDGDIDTDAEWQVFNVNKLGNVMVSQANHQAQAAVSWTRKTFTRAT